MLYVRVKQFLLWILTMLTSSDGPNRLGSAELEGSGSVKLEGSVRFGG